MKYTAIEVTESTEGLTDSESSAPSVAKNECFAIGYMKDFATEITEHTEKSINTDASLSSVARHDPDPLTEQVIGAAIEVHRHLGPGLLESIHEEALCHELALRGIPFERQKGVDVVYKGKVIKGQRLDLLIAGEVVVEIKSVRHLEDVFIAQVLSYLKSTGLKRGLLINFGQRKLIDGVKRLSL